MAGKLWDKGFEPDRMIEEYTVGQDRELDLRGGRYTHYAGRFEELVGETLAELYDPSVPFRQCADADTCKYCDFNVLCRR